MSTPRDVTMGDRLFQQASRDVLEYLHEHVPLTVWAVTRVENGRQTFLTVSDAGYGLGTDSSHEWAESYCVQMVTGTAPAVAPDAQDVPAYAAAGVNTALSIGAFAGAAITDADGALFGTICGLDPQPQGTQLQQVEPLLALLSRLLSVALIGDRQTQASARAALEARLAADVDPLTGAYTRGAWDRVLAAEQAVSEQLADPTAVVVVDLDDLKQTNDARGHAAGDDLLVRAVEAICAAVRSQDPVARLGGDEFAVLLRGCNDTAASARADAVRQSLHAAGIAASVGAASASPDGGLAAAQAAADRAMYREKRRRKA